MLLTAPLGGNGDASFIAGIDGLASRFFPQSRARRAVENHVDAFDKGGAKYALLYDPQTAGGLLATVPPDQAEAAVKALQKIGYARAAAIGTVLAVGDPADFPAKVVVNA